MKELHVPYEVIPNPEGTKSRILLAAAELFALSGYSAVSIKEIATAAGIKSASLYNHFSSKKSILDTMMKRFEEELLDFYSILDDLAYKANNLAEILENIFSEVKEVMNPFSCYVILCAMNTQFEFASSRHLFYDIYYLKGHMVIRNQLQTAIERGLAPAFDVGEIASLITNCILMTVSFNVGKIHGFYSDFDISEWCGRQINHILYIAEIMKIPKNNDFTL